MGEVPAMPPFYLCKFECGRDKKRGWGESQPPGLN